MDDREQDAQVEIPLKPFAALKLDERFQVVGPGPVGRNPTQAVRGTETWVRISTAEGREPSIIS